MSLRISNNSGTFDLPKDFNAEIEDSSPIYNERGSQSIAATIPGTKNNLRLNNDIHRTDIDSGPVADERVIVADGVYHRIGKMNTVKASKKEGITFNIGFGESELYSIWNAISLQSLSLPTFAPGSVNELCTYMNEVFTRKHPESPFAIFPISATCNRKEENESYTEYHDYLNKLETYLTLDWKARVEKFIINGEVVDVSLPAGYGVTPFLKVSYILEAIFSSYGYTVIENPFSAHHQLQGLVVLNNAADCCVKGEVKYADLMPDCTINEFMQALWCRFGLLYFVDGNTRTVRLKFIRDIIKTNYSEDWTLSKASEPIYNFETPQQLKLSAATNIKGPIPHYTAAPAAESLDKFLKPFHYIVSTKSNGYLQYIPSLGRYYKYDNLSDSSEFLSTEFFPWDRGADLSYKEITSIDESLPMATAIFGSSSAYISSKLPLYLFGKVHRYTTITSSDVDLSEELESQTPLCFCFAFPTSYATEGSSICIDSNRKPITDKDGTVYDISLIFVGQYGLFNHFWKDYDAILRHANHIVETDIHLSAKQCMNPDFSASILLDGQRMLPDSIRYTLPQKSTSPAKVKLRTLKLLKPFDLEKEQTVPIVDQLYRWVLYDNKSATVDAAVRSQKEAWRDAINQEGSNRSFYDLQYKNISSDTVDIKVPLSVPTEEEYNDKKEYFIRKVNHSFDLYYRVRTYLGVSGGTIHYEISDPIGGVHYDLQYDQYVRAELL